MFRALADAGLRGLLVIGGGGLQGRLLLQESLVSQGRE
jgi:hypothetical protein